MKSKRVAPLGGIGPAFDLAVCSLWALAQPGVDLAEMPYTSARQLASSGAGFQLTDTGIAIIRLTGTLSKSPTSVGDSMTEVGASIRAAIDNSRVRGMLLFVESHGGTIAGTQVLADAVAAAGTRKPVHAFIEDIGTGSAYWIASQASHITTNQTGMVGGIGVHSVHVDSSARELAAGRKVHVIRTGPHKGAGVPGSAITASHLAHIQDRVDAIGKLFADAVAKSRKLTPDRMKLVTDGRVFVGKNAKAAGLVDAVGGLDDAYSLLASKVGASPGQSQTPTTARPGVEPFRRTASIIRFQL